MSVEVSHPIFKKVKLNVLVEKETSCVDCVHDKVCSFDYSKVCENYVFGDSSQRGCYSCLHRFTRWDNVQAIPCFKCKYFLPPLKPDMVRVAP